MPELLKDRYYNFNSIHELAIRIKAIYPSFRDRDFISDIMDETWEALSLKGRMRHITINLGKYLPSEYEQALAILDQVIASYPAIIMILRSFTSRILLKFMDRLSVIGICQWLP